MSKLNIVKRIDRIEELINAKTSIDSIEPISLVIGWDENPTYIKLGDRKATPKEEKEAMKKLTKYETGSHFHIVLTDDVISSNE